MKIVSTLICLLMIAGAATSQTVEVLNNSGFQAPVKSQFFAYLFHSADTTGKNFIATLQASGSGKHSDVEELFSKIKDKALEAGANAYRFKSFTRDSIAKTSILTLDAYYANDVALFANAERTEKGVIYIFGDAEKSNKTYSFKLNGEKKEFKGGSFYKHVMKPGEEVKINKGGFAGATVCRYITSALKIRSITIDTGKASDLLVTSMRSVLDYPGDLRFTFNKEEYKFEIMSQRTWEHASTLLTPNPV